MQPWGKFERSDSSYNSQTTIVLKPDKSGRLCIFLNLNECTDDDALPNLPCKADFQRIGVLNPRSYSEMIDFTIVPEYNHLSDEEAASYIVLSRYAELDVIVTTLLYVLY